jgi:hypothetical protein
LIVSLEQRDGMVIAGEHHAEPQSHHSAADDNYLVHCCAPLLV